MFQRGAANLRGGNVSWKSGLAGSKPPWLYRQREWLPIGQTVGAFDRSVLKHNQVAAASYLTARLQAKVNNRCVQTILGFSGWPRSYGYSIRLWNKAAATAVSRYASSSGKVVDSLRLVHSGRWRIMSVQRGRNGSVSCPPWSPPQNAFPGTFAVGDSVMVDAQPYLNQMGITVDAQVSRQFDTGVAILRGMISQGSLPPEWWSPLEQTDR